MDAQMADDPAAYLLHLTPTLPKYCKCSLTIQLLRAAKAPISHFWKQSMAPPLGFWPRKLGEIYRMENILASAHGRKQ